MNRGVTSSAPSNGRPEHSQIEAKPQSIVRALFGSLAFKIGAAVIVTEILVLTGIGIPLNARHDADIDRRAVDRILIPGTLLQEHVLSYASVADRRIMTDLLGEELIGGMVVGGNGNVFYSLDPGQLGADVGELPGIDPAWFDPSDTERRLIETQGDGDTFLISITPLFTLDSKVPSLFAYIKTNTTKLTESKAAWRRLVFMGALAVVLTTSLIIFISFQMLIFRRIIRSADFVERVREGDLETLLTAPGSDEFGTLERGMNEMVANLKRRQDQQTKAEEALRHSETRLLQAQDIARIGHFVLDTKTNGVIYRSDVICDIYGISSDEAPSTFAETLEFIHPDDRARVAAASKAAGAADEGYDVEYRIVRPDGEIRYVQEIANPERDETGTTVRSVGTFKDITVRKRAEEEILRLNESLEQRVEERTAKLLEAHEALVRQERLATLGRLTATVSHELRNPLGALRSAIAVIKRLAGDDPPLLQESAEIADRSISRCDGIIADLLDYSRTQPLNLQTAPIDDWLGRLLDEYETPEGVALVRELDGDMEIAFDHDRLRRALINLMDNACQAMVGNGVPAKAGHGDESILTIATRIENGLLELIIGDTGPGIPHDERAKVFEPLHSTKNFGVGLGLPIVRQIVEMHGGDITIDGEAGEGARFTLRLPLDLRKDQFVVREPQAPRDAPPRRVLIVGDDRDFADSLRNFLMLKSYEVVVAYGADQAKAEANAFEPQVAIIDYRLGHTVGLDLVAPLTHRCPGIICLLATAHSDQDTAISALRSGIRDYLKKPINVEELIVVLDRCFDEKPDRERISDG